MRYDLRFEVIGSVWSIVFPQGRYAIHNSVRWPVDALSATQLRMTISPVR